MLACASSPIFDSRRLRGFQDTLKHTHKLFFFFAQIPRSIWALALDFCALVWVMGFKSTCLCPLPLPITPPPSPILGFGQIWLQPTPSQPTSLLVFALSSLPDFMLCLYVTLLFHFLCYGLYFVYYSDKGNKLRTSQIFKTY